MLEIKSFFGGWQEVTKEQAERFYREFYTSSTAIHSLDKKDYFNKNHIRGGHVIGIGNFKIETDEELQERRFQVYKSRLEKETHARSKGKIRFCIIEYLCRFPEIDPFLMAVSFMNDGITILYDDSSISQEKNNAKQQKVNRTYKKFNKERNKS